jgi:hypothetical protein
VELTGLGLSLVLAAAGLALTHTLLGPDHYLPFVMLARARGWSTARTMLVTAICGVGHVASSIAIGGIGIVAGTAVARIEGIEGGRGDLAAWALVAFGIAYGLWGMRRALRSSRGIEPHTHHGHVHVHSHGTTPHEHGSQGDGSNTTFWALFVVFVLGPCEPLIPLFVLPASRGSWPLAGLTAAVFGIVTIATMLAATAAGLVAARQIRLGPLERWSHTLAGAVVAGSGLAILFLGL